MVNSKYHRYMRRRILKEKNAIKQCKTIIDMVHEHCNTNNEFFRDDFRDLADSINSLEIAQMEAIVKVVLKNIHKSVWKTDLERYYFFKRLTW